MSAPDSKDDRVCEERGRLLANDELLSAKHRDTEAKVAGADSEY